MPEDNKKRLRESNNSVRSGQRSEKQKSMFETMYECELNKERVFRKSCVFILSAYPFSEMV